MAYREGRPSNQPVPITRHAAESLPHLVQSLRLALSFKGLNRMADEGTLTPRCVAEVLTGALSHAFDLTPNGPDVQERRATFNIAHLIIEKFHNGAETTEQVLRKVACMDIGATHDPDAILVVLGFNPDTSHIPGLQSHEVVRNTANQFGLIA